MSSCLHVFFLLNHIRTVVIPGQESDVLLVSQFTTDSLRLLIVQVDDCVPGFFFPVWDCIVPELQDSSAKKNFTFTFLSTSGKFISI